MNDLKYVIIIPPGMELSGARAIIFNGLINHCDVVSQSMLDYGFKVHSAGFFCFEDKDTTKVKVWGKSESLGVECDEIIDRITILLTVNRSHPLF